MSVWYLTNDQRRVPVRCATAKCNTSIVKSAFQFAGLNKISLECAAQNQTQAWCVFYAGRNPPESYCSVIKSPIPGAGPIIDTMVKEGQRVVSQIAAGAKSIAGPIIDPIVQAIEGAAELVEKFIVGLLKGK